MSPTAKFFNAIFFLAAALSIVAIGAQELHRRHGGSAERTAESRRIMSELQPAAAPAEERASHRWDGRSLEPQQLSEEEEASRLTEGLEGDDRSEFSKFIDRIKPW